MQAVCTSETSINFKETIRPYIPASSSNFCSFYNVHCNVLVLLSLRKETPRFLNQANVFMNKDHRRGSQQTNKQTNKHTTNLQVSSYLLKPNVSYKFKSYCSKIHANFSQRPFQHRRFWALRRPKVKTSYKTQIKKRPYFAEASLETQRQHINRALLLE
jgi:hypothetical protein